jgi:AraC-like DNA-binding protein
VATRPGEVHIGTARRVREPIPGDDLRRSGRRAHLPEGVLVIQVFESTDAGAIHDMLNRTCTRVRMSGTGVPQRLRVTQVDLGRASLLQISSRMRVTAEVASTGVITVGRARSGSVTCATGARSADYHPGELFLPAPPDQDLRASSVDFDGEFAGLPVDVFTQLADGAPSRAQRPIRFLAHRSISAEAAAVWNRTYDYVRDSIAGLSTDDQPLVVGVAVQMLAAVTLSTFPNTAMHDPTAEDRHDARPPALNRALAFIEENAGRSITPADIAVAAHVTIRTLQLAFRRYLDTTPSAYLRQVRLNRAHDDLLRADPHATTVSRIAMRWGFASHSTFTAQYRLAYGVTPSHTLHC